MSAPAIYRPTPGFLVRHPAHFIALGFGTGLSPIVPGTFGTLLAFPLGVLLALGRRSELPIIRSVSIAYIELVRGVPLITVLFMASIMFALFMPVEMALNRAWGGRPHRDFWKSRGLAFLMTVAGGLLALGSIVMSGSAMLFLVMPGALIRMVPVPDAWPFTTAPANAVAKPRLSPAASPR